MSAGRARHDKLVMLVEKMLALTPKLRAAKPGSETATLQNAVSKTDHDIDALVYDIYALTPEEIALVEQGNYEQRAVSFPKRVSLFGHRGLLMGGGKAFAGI